MGNDQKQFRLVVKSHLRQTPNRITPRFFPGEWKRLQNRSIIIIHRGIAKDLPCPSLPKGLPHSLLTGLKFRPMVIVWTQVLQGLLHLDEFAMGVGVLLKPTGKGRAEHVVSRVFQDLLPERLLIDHTSALNLRPNDPAELQAALPGQNPTRDRVRGLSAPSPG